MNKKTISRTVTLLAILLLFTAIGTFYYMKLELQENNGKTDLFSLVPKECEAIIEVNNIRNLFQKLQYTAFSESYKDLQISDLIRLLDESSNRFDEQKAHGLSGRMNHLLISFHSPGSPADQVVYGHLGNEDKDFIHSLLKQTENASPFQKEVEYNGEDILIYPLDNQKFLACYFHKGFYAISFQKKLIEKVIDTYRQRMPSIQHDTTFALLSTQKKPANSLYLYARSLPLSNWTEFDIRIHNESIYMTGNCMDSSSHSFAHTMTEGKKVGLIANQSLPEKTILFYQLALSDSTSMLSSYRNDSITIPLSDHAFYDFMKHCTSGEINGIEFEDNDTKALHRILMIPLLQPLTGTEPEWENIVRMPSQFKRINGKNYPISSLQKGTFLNRFMPQSPTQKDVPLYATLFNRQLLLSKRAEDLICYIQLLTSRIPTQHAFQEEMADLSQEPHFTLFTDMEQLFEYPQEYAQYIPSFFFKHKHFFQHFTFSLQLVKASDNINANIIFTYKTPRQTSITKPS